MAQNSRTKNTILNGVAGVLTQCVTLATTFATRTIFIRELGIEYAGVQGVFSDILTILSFAELGIGSAITYALYKPIAENDNREIGKYMFAYKVIYRFIALTVFLVGCSFIPFLHFIINGVPNIVEDIILIYFLFVVQSASSYLLIYKATFLTAAQKDYLVSKFKIITSIGIAIVQCLFLLLYHSFVIYLIFSILAALLQNYIIACIAEREYPILKDKCKIKLSKEERITLFSNVRALFLYKVSGVALNGTSSLITSIVVNTVTVGVLSNYKLLTNQLKGFLSQVFKATAASIGNLAVTSSGENQHKVFQQMLFICFLVYCISSTILFTVVNPFMQLWLGQRFVFDFSIVAVIVLDFFIEGMLSPISQFRTSNGLFVQGKYRPVIMAILNVIFSVWLGKKLGVAGIFLGIITARALTQLWFDPWILYKYVFKRSIVSYFAIYLKYVFVALLCCSMSRLAITAIGLASPICNVVIGGFLAIILSLGCIYVFFHRTEEYLYSIQLVKKIAKRKL